MASIATAARRVKDEVGLWLSMACVNEACMMAQHAWRERVLTPWVTLQAFAQQVLHANASCRRVTRLNDRSFSSAAYCKARQRLPVEVFGYLAAALTHNAVQKSADFGRWLGHRVLHIDGSGASMPDTPALQAAFGQPAGQRAGCGFPLMHVLWLFDAATGLIIDFIADRGNTHDMAHAAQLHGQMQAGDVLVGDRAFASFAHLALLLQAKLHGVIRAHQRRIISFTPAPAPGSKSRRRCARSQRSGVPSSRWIRTLGPDDQLVEYRKPKQRPKWIDAQAYADLPETIVVRELRYRIKRPGFRTQSVTLVTTLTDPRQYSTQALAELYQARWQIETSLRHLKQTMGMDVLHCQTVEGVQKELWMYLIVYNQVRLFMLEAARRQGVPPDRISFIDALDVLRCCGFDAADARKLLVNPLRPDRHEPRVIKRRKDRYSYMTRPREELRKQLGISRNAA